ncbi:MAG: GTP-binding protein [Candidatus Levybacteria bacterium]|nr:GTP-binding protein [Candidatus Levybacteria bacterium]
MDKKIKQLIPPVIAVLGHVDHGKTSLLDAIRKTNIAAREHGGITQKIGASQIETIHDGVNQRITFIDTPGHEAFSRMRSRGAQAADIGLLVVSAIDGVMPQTKEAISLLKDAKIPYIVVITKVDLPDHNVEKVKQQLLHLDVLLEGLGGNIPYIGVSAKTNYNIQALLDLILLFFELNDGGKNISPTDLFKAIIIESRLDQKMGVKATIVIKSGNLETRDDIVCDGITARVRLLINDKGEQMKNVGVGDAVEVLGFNTVPSVGATVTKKGEIDHEQIPMQEIVIPTSYSPHLRKNVVSIILCCDTLGSLEAIAGSLPADVKIISQKSGEISEADVLLAKSTGALVIGFNTKIRSEVIHLSKQEKILMKNYAIIYELIDELADVLEGKQLSLEEKIFGRATILASFPFEKTKVAGIRVLEGRVARGDKARILRDETIIGESVIISLRQGKNQISKIEKGVEGGVILSPALDFTIGDMIVFHE